MNRAMIKTSECEDDTMKIMIILWKPKERMFCKKCRKLQKIKKSKKRIDF